MGLLILKIFFLMLAVLYGFSSCGHMGPFGENPTDAKRKWNEMIRRMSHE